jgi:hypothetical protein
VDEALAAELVALAEEDQRVRAELLAEGTLFDGYNPRMEEVHVRNAARLTEILDAHGWPGRALVGEEGSRAAFMIVQHAISRPSLQRRALPLLEEAAARGEIDPVQVAYLDDRIRTHEGRGQRYGTQFDWDEQGELSPLPLDDPDGVETRRASIGLEPLDEKLRQMRADMQGEQPPADWAERRREIDAWARSVGWR